MFEVSSNTSYSMILFYIDKVLPFVKQDIWPFMKPVLKTKGFKIYTSFKLWFSNLCFPLTQTTFASSLQVNC